MACYKHATPPGFKITELIIETHKDFCPLRFMLLLPRIFFRFIGGQSLLKSIHILLKEVQPVSQAKGRFEFARFDVAIDTFFAALGLLTDSFDG